ncbi:MAG: protein kinase [Verrucomicrobiota bacterium]
MRGVCSTCGTTIRPNSPGGLCPRCLLGLANSTSQRPTAPTPDSNSGHDFLTESQVRHLGDYELIDEIARGGMGIVYRAHQISLNRHVALKMILAGQLATPDSVQRFRLEAKAAAKLDHPHIVPIYEIGEHETQHYFTMKLVDGGSLADRLPAYQLPRPNESDTNRRGRGRESERRIAAMLVKLAEALAYAHAHGVLHRDIKPNNILLDREGEPYLTDFGLAKLTVGSSGLTISVTVLGSPSYMAPEQAAGNTRDVTTSADVYGLGAVLYELITGRPPFVGATAVETVRKVVEEPPVSPARINPAVSRDLATICLKCLEKEPARRYRSATVLAEELERFRQGEPILARPVSAPEQVWRWCKRKPAIASLSLAAILIFVVGLAGVLWQWRRAELSRRQAQLSNQELRRTLAHLEWRAIDTLLEQDYAGRAVAHLADRLRKEPSSWQAASYAISILEQRLFAMPTGLELTCSGGLDPAPPVISADGRRVALAGPDHRVRVCDAATGADLLPPLAHGSSVVGLAFVPDGTAVVTATAQGEINAWEIASGSLRHHLSSQSNPLRALVFSRNGEVCATLGGPLVEVWRTVDLQEGGPPRTILQPAVPPDDLRLSETGARALTWTHRGERSACLWDSQTGARLSAGCDSGSMGVLATMDSAGERLATIEGQHEVAIWDILTKKRLSTLRSDSSPIESVVFARDPERVVLVYRIGSVQVFSIANGRPLSRAMKHLYAIFAAASDEAGTRLATASQDHGVRVWNLTNGHPLSELMLHQGPVLNVSFALRAERLLTVASDSGRPLRRVQSWDLRRESGPRRFQPPGARDLNMVRLSPDAQWVVVPAWTPTEAVWIYHANTGQLVFGPTPVGGDVYGIEFTPDGKRLILATANGWLYGWSVEDWRPLWEPVLTPGAIQPTALSPDGNVFATGGPDGYVRLWETHHGQLLREMKQAAHVKGLRFSPEGARLIAGSADGVAVIWDVHTGQPRVKLEGHTAEILSVEFSQDGQKAVTASYDSTVRVWNALTGQPLGPILRHQGEASHASFSPDGKRVATSARDGTARIWDIQTGLPLVDWMRHEETVQSVEFHPDGRRLLTRDHAGFRLWDIDTGEPVTIHYSDPVTGGVGVDATSVRELLSRDARRVFLGCSTDAATLWDLPDPPSGAPAWFPDFLEAAVGQRIGAAGEYLRVPPATFQEFRTRADDLGGSDDFYARWLRRYLDDRRLDLPKGRSAH